MNTIRVSATKARNNFFELLNQVAMGKSVIIERDSKEVAVLSTKKSGFDREALLKASKKIRGIFKDYDLQDSPLRRKGAWPTLGKWDKGLKWSRKRT